MRRLVLPYAFVSQRAGAIRVKTRDLLSCLARQTFAEGAFEAMELNFAPRHLCAAGRNDLLENRRIQRSRD